MAMRLRAETVQVPPARRGWRSHDDFADMCAAEGKTVETARANLRIEKGPDTVMTS